MQEQELRSYGIAMPKISSGLSQNKAFLCTVRGILIFFASFGFAFDFGVTLDSSFLIYDIENFKKEIFFEASSNFSCDTLFKNLTGFFFTNKLKNFI